MKRIDSKSNFSSPFFPNFPNSITYKTNDREKSRVKENNKNKGHILTRMLNLGNVEETSKPTAPAANSAPNGSSTAQPPPPMYGSAPPSYGAFQQNRDVNGASTSNPNLPGATATNVNTGPTSPTGPTSGAPPPSYSDRPPAYSGGGPTRGGYGGPRRAYGSVGGASGEEGAPNRDEAVTRENRYKSKICQNYLNGTCNWGTGCSYIHTNYEPRPYGSPNTSNANAPSFGSVSGAPPPSYERVSQQPPPYHSSPTKAPPRTPPPMQGFPSGGVHYVNSGPISPRSPMKLSSPTGTGTGQRFRHEPYSALGKAFSSDNLQGLASGHQSPRDQSASVNPSPAPPPASTAEK